MWSFQSDLMETWAAAPDCFTPQQCDEIIKIGKERGMTIGNTFTPYNDKDERDANVSWIDSDQEDVKWIFERLTDVSKHINERYFGFDLWGWGEPLQFTEYNAPTGHHAYHIDRRKGFIPRKLSCVVLLSDPLNYTGGDFQIREQNEDTNLPRDRGMALFFPTFVQHRVTQVTKGQRYSLVGWVTGEAFK